MMYVQLIGLFVALFVGLPNLVNTIRGRGVHWINFLLVALGIVAFVAPWVVQ